MSTDNVNTEATAPETPAPEAQAPATEGTLGGAQPTPAQQNPTPAQDIKPGSEPTVPYSRFAEVLAERNRLRQAQQQPQPLMPQQGPKGPPKQEDFATYEEYLDARADYRAETRFHSLQEQQQRQAQVHQYQERAMRAEINFAQKLHEAAAKDPSVLPILQTAPTLRDDLQVNLKEHKDPVGLAKHLAQNPNLVFEMNNLPPDLAVQRMWEIGQSLAGSKTQPVSASKAPPPISPVGAGKTNTSGGYRSDMSQEEFNATFRPIW